MYGRGCGSWNARQIVLLAARERRFSSALISLSSAGVMRSHASSPANAANPLINSRVLRISALFVCETDAPGSAGYRSDLQPPAPSTLPGNGVPPNGQCLAQRAFNFWKHAQAVFPGIFAF